MKKLLLLLVLLPALFVSPIAFAVPILNSLPGASSTIYLDFDGHEVSSAYWNGGNSFVCAPSGLSDLHATEVFNRVSEDFRPFNINITTDLSKYLAAPLSSRMRIVITTTSNWFTGVGGVSLTGSFTWGDDTPAFVFADRLGPFNTKMVAECCSHESGHTLGLSHQSRYDGTCNLTATYHDGTGLGTSAWAPIMGNSYYRNMSGWNDGPTPNGCAETQDNLSTITTQNGFSFREDDHSNDIHNNPARMQFPGLTNGIITTNTDKDAFKFDLYSNASIHIDIRPFSITNNFEGANLDVKMQLFDSNKNLLRTYDPTAAMNVEMDTILTAGTYYLLLDGTGNMNIGDYGSLGSYTISASTSATLPVRQAELTGRTINNQHQLNWNVISDEPVHTQLENSTDGRTFKAVNSITTQSSQLVYTPSENRNFHYRVKVINASGKVFYSNTILLQALPTLPEHFTVSTFIHSEINVQATKAYHYIVNDLNGNRLISGKASAGINNIDMSRYSNGIYLLQLSGNGQNQTKRIIKQ